MRRHIIPILKKENVRKMIKDCETNMVYLAEGLKHYPKVHANLTSAIQDAHIAISFLPGTASKKHVWARDFMPILLEKDKFLQYTYSPDYLKDEPEYIPDYPGICSQLNLGCTTTEIVLDGGNVIKCDDKVIMTNKIFQENPHYDSNSLIKELEELLQAEIIIIPWDKYEPYGHADGMVRYIDGNRVLLNNYINFDPYLRKRLLSALTPHFVIEELDYGCTKVSKTSWAYINFLQTESCIFVPGLNNPKDNLALEQIQHHYPGYKVRQIEGCEELVRDGGALNCISWNILTQRRNDEY